MSVYFVSAHPLVDTEELNHLWPVAEYDFLAHPISLLSFCCSLFDLMLLVLHYHSVFVCILWMCCDHKTVYKKWMSPIGL